MASIHPTTDDHNRDWSKFRFGQPYSYEGARFISDRDAYGRLITRDLPEEALGPGVDIVDPTTREPLKNNMEIWEVLERDWEELIKAFEQQRAFEWSILGIFDRDNPLAKIKGKNVQAPIMLAFEPSDVDNGNTTFYSDHTLKGTKLRKWSKETANTTDQDWYYVGEVDTPEGKDIIKAPIENAYFVSPTYKRKFWEGRSELECLWDLLWGLRAIHMGCTIFAIRKGAGLKIIIMPPDASAEDIEQMKDGAKRLDSFDGFWLAPEGADVKIDATGQADYNSLKDAILRAISAKLKIPKARLDGIEPGNLEGAKVNEEAMFDVWRRIQRLARPIIKWIIERYNSVYEWFPEKEEGVLTEWDIEFRVRESIDEEKEATILATNVSSYTEAINADLISVTNAQKELGFPEEEVNNPKPILGTLQIGDDPDDESDKESKENSNQGSEGATDDSDK